VRTRMVSGGLVRLKGVLKLRDYIPLCLSCERRGGVRENTIWAGPVSADHHEIRGTR
jgi:hypothetical protein